MKLSTNDMIFLNWHELKILFFCDILISKIIKVHNTSTKIRSLKTSKCNDKYCEDH